jgi:ketosteroid isomerase-like protein
MTEADVKVWCRETIRRYFRYVDAGDSRLRDLYTDDVELLFPKFGRTRGKDGMRVFGARMAAMLGRLEHDIDGLTFIEAGDTVVVECREWGEMADGTPFPDGEISQGLLCNLFEFDGDLIKAVRIYFTSTDKARIDALH